MKKNELLNLKRRLEALAMAGVMLGTVGCMKKDGDSKKSSSSIEDFGYFIRVEEDGEKEIRYYNKSVYLLYDMETYDTTIWIYEWENGLVVPEGFELRLYDYRDIEDHSGNENKPVSYEDYNYKLENSYIVNLSEAGDYVDGHVSKTFYTIEEIKELAPQIAVGVKNLGNSYARY